MTEDKDTELEEFPVWVTCHRCGYKWLSYGLLDRVTCPSCGIKTPRVSAE